MNKKKMNKNQSKVDALFSTFETFKVSNKGMIGRKGGENTNGSFHDPDGCTARWRDTSEGFEHMEDHSTPAQPFRVKKEN